ncbi:hypothetical protein PoB_007026200 [Plakobranchus ocellatus]|uniref:Uncharacterized protein n=1 Tax=Plakobranchus ocellatus TaxID=259542 RepID=A0AAV4DHN9_9GAST|nr:hypothetical protein PoB_007026200 [Plakobranchus ocellatus]
MISDGEVAQSVGHLPIVRVMASLISSAVQMIAYAPLCPRCATHSRQGRTSLVTLSSPPSDLCEAGLKPPRL